MKDGNIANFHHPHPDKEAKCYQVKDARAVDDYLETCAKVGKEPQKPYSDKMMFRVDPAIHRKTTIAAGPAGKSRNQWAEEALDEAASNLSERRLAG